MTSIKVPAQLRALLNMRNNLNKRTHIIIGGFALVLLLFTIVSIGSEPSLTSVRTGYTPGNAGTASKNLGGGAPPSDTNGVGSRNGYYPNTKIKNSDDFYYKLFRILSKTRPVTPPEDMNVFRNKDLCKMGEIAVHAKKEDLERLSFENLEACYNLTESQFDNLHSSHKLFTKTITEDFRLTSKLANMLWPNDKGIVTIGGGRYSIISLTMIKTLRAKGTTLPVEVIIPPTNERETEYCEKVLPSLNAKCVYFEDVMPKKFADNVKLRGFQLKPFALLVSSFKHVMFIDADDLPLKNLDKVFNAKPYKKFGLILWPDLWRRVTAPSYYRIADISYNLDKRVRIMADDISPISRYDNVKAPTKDYKLRKTPFHDMEGTLPDLTTESGQILLDKVMHFDTLLLTTYYNFYGPIWYYRLFTQGTAGEGDKETYIAAAHALGKPYYQVKTNLAFDGYNSKEDGFNGIGLYQQDFEEDYKRYVAAKSAVSRDFGKFSAYMENYDYVNDFQKGLLNPQDSPYDAMFVHVSYNKLEPLNLAKEKKYIENGTHFRGFRRNDILKGWDLELDTTTILNEAFCSKNVIEFSFYKNNMNKPEWKEMCMYLEDRQKFLEETHEEAFNTKEDQ